MDLALDLLLFAVPWAHVLYSPYTKVEESFNLHATHDVLMYGVGSDGLQQYDHFIFPGVVPRTFIGAIALAWISTPVIWLARSVYLIRSKLDLQIVVRLVLATLNSVGLLAIRRAVSRKFGPLTASFLVALSCTQFHLPFWIGRTLPNMFALLPVNFATSFLVRPSSSPESRKRHIYIAIGLLTSTCVILRAELVPLLAPTVLEVLLLEEVTVLEILSVGLLSGFTSLGLTVLVDSYFWRQFPMWPEFTTIYFNVYQGKSEDWGVSPFYTYFTAHLPKLLLASMPLSVLGFAIDSRCRRLLATPLAFVLLLSCLRHKEWRFIVYVVPVFNIGAARAASWLFKRRFQSIFARLLAWGVIAALLGNIFISCLLTAASSRNYPGGVALSALNKRFGDLPVATVYIDNLAAQTGASLFLHEHSAPHLHSSSGAKWAYVKTENLTDFSSFSHVLTERPWQFPGAPWEQSGIISGFSGRFALRTWMHSGKGIIEEEDKLWIFKWVPPMGT